MSNIVVVEDNEALNTLLCRTLRNAGHDVFGFLDAESLLEHPSLQDVDLAVLDIQLPGESGIELAQRLRASMPNLGIVMLTTQSSNAHRIQGYSAGADFYLPKPISADELCVAVQSLLDRKRLFVVQPVSAPARRCVLSRTSLAMSLGQRWLKLSPSECKVLVALACAPGRQLEYWQILDIVNTMGESISRRTLDVRMYRLRSKLTEFTAEPHTIVSVRGVGYRLGFDLETQ